jgi:nicotinic acetylcholine receptor, invertebrate
LYRYSADNLPVADKENKIAITWQGVTSFGGHFVRTSACVVQIEQYPYDQQNCSILFRSQLYSETALRVVLFSNRTVASKGSYETNPAWDLVASGSEIAVWNVDGYDYHFVQINIVIRRRPGFYIYILVVPSLLLSILTPLLFWVPPSRPDRTTLGKNVINVSAPAFLSFSP